MDPLQLTRFTSQKIPALEQKKPHAQRAMRQNIRYSDLCVSDGSSLGEKRKSDVLCTSHLKTSAYPNYWSLSRIYAGGICLVVTDESMSYFIGSPVLLFPLLVGIRQIHTRMNLTKIK